MSVSPISVPDWTASYTPSSTPAGLDAIARGDAPAPGPAPTTSSSSSTSSATSTGTTTSTQNPYQTELQNLTAYDAQELIQTSLASPAAATSNVQSVLAQAAVLQQEGQLTQQSAQSQTPAFNADPTGALNVPSYGSIIQASDDAANTALANLGSGTGTNVDTTA